MSALQPARLACLTPTTRPGELAATALVPVLEVAHRAAPVRVPSPDPTFVAQMMAGAQQQAERRRWPRDRAADAFSAYHARKPRPTGSRTRQTV